MPPLIQALPQWAQMALLVVPAISAIFAALALLLNFFQSRRTNAQARAALVAGCLKGFTDDDAIQDAFNSIEYSTFIYGPDFHNSEAERQIDKLLRHFANLALSWQGGLLSTQDIRPVRYYIVRVMRDPQIGRYMEFMAHWSKTAAVGQHPYAVLVQLSDALSKLPL